MDATEDILGMNIAAKGLVVFSFFCFGILLAAVASGDCDEKVVARIRLDQGHLWQPPFGLERVGRPLTAAVEIDSQQRPSGEFWLSGYVDGREVERRDL